MLEPIDECISALLNNSLTLSSILPAILDLQSNLQQRNVTATAATKSVTANTLRAIQKRFESVFDVNSKVFNPLPASACLLDPTRVKAIRAPEFGPLLQAAKMYVVGACAVMDAPSEEGAAADGDAPPLSKRFRFFAAWMREKNENALMSSQTVLEQLEKYLDECADTEEGALEFWRKREVNYAKIAGFAEDLLMVPAAQGYKAGLISLFEMLYKEQIEREAMEARAFLKINATRKIDLLGRVA